MKLINDIDREQGPVCAVWQNSPADSKAMHTRKLIPVETLAGKIKICTKCQQDILDLVAFQKRISIGTKLSKMISPKIVIRSEGDINRMIDQRAGIQRRKHNRVEVT